MLQGVASEIIDYSMSIPVVVASKYSWQMLRDSLHACHLYVSKRAILLRPLIPPSGTHPPFASAKQRIYMSATLGAGGDLERYWAMSNSSHPVPSGWDQQGIAAGFLFFQSARSTMTRPNISL